MQTKISIQQLKALQLYNQGYTRRQAAARLCISEHTYAWYLKKIREKFGISSRREMLSLEEAISQYYGENTAVI